MKNPIFKALIFIFSIFGEITYLSGNEQEVKSISGIYGRVLSGGEGAPFVAVYIKDTNHGTSTDADGNFILDDLPEGKYVVKVQGIGYRSLEKEVEIVTNRLTELHLRIEEDIHFLEGVAVSGSRLGLLRFLPGSANTISSSDIKAISPHSGNEVLRHITGIHVVEEEGAGLRANIGIRGLDPDKSRNVLILEDGIPVALGPYGEPEMYYSPAIDRMSGVEILKGSGSILYGPQTIGGVINYITADPPSESTGTVNLSGGRGGYYTGQIGYGSTFGNTGFQVTYLRRQAENLGPTEFTMNDISSKLRFRASPRSNVMIKLGIYDENSNSTYIGLTQVMYDRGGLDYLRLAPDDHLEIRRYSIGVNHTVNFNDDFKLSTTAYAYTTARNWKRQDFTSDPEATNLTGVVWGEMSVPEGAIFLRNSTGNRNRQFEVAGIESRLKYRYRIVDKENLLDGGTRFLYERAFEQRVNGTTAGAVSGFLRDDEVRTGNAASTWVKNKLLLSEKFSFTTGLRAEMLEYGRHILRSGSADVNIMNNSFIMEIIPGAGINYNFNDRSGIFTGIHRGFAPPRIKDAITSDGEDLQLEAEKSWNFEFGTRAEPLSFLKLELTFFNMDFSNQVIPVSESSGGKGIGYLNGGRTKHRGFETELSFHISDIFKIPGKLSLNLNAAVTESVFSDDRFVVHSISKGGLKDTVFVNVKGNHTPYAPGVISSGYLHYDGIRGFGIRIGGHYTGVQYTDVLNTENVNDWIVKALNNPEYEYVQATGSGQIGKLPSFIIMNVSAWYDLPGGLNLNVCIKNLLNERYITSRRPQGIRVGLPRMLSAGLSYDFGINR